MGNIGNYMEKSCRNNDNNNNSAYIDNFAQNNIIQNGVQLQKVNHQILHILLLFLV
jgi:hypothetical protein